MAGVDELTLRVEALEAALLNAVTMPAFFVKQTDSVIEDKTGYWVVFEGVPGIQGGSTGIGKSAVANPTLTAHFSEFLIVK